MTSISGLGSTVPFSLAPASGAATSVPLTTSNTAGLVQDAVTLSSEASALSTLGGSSSLYDAAGLLQQFASAGTAQGTAVSPSPGDGTDGGASAQTAQDAGVVAQLPQDSTTSGLYNATGALSALPSDQNANWAQLVQQQPELAGTAVADATTLGIISQLA